MRSSLQTTHGCGRQRAGDLAGFSQVMKEEVFVGLRTERTRQPQDGVPHSQRNKRRAGKVGVLMRRAAAFTSGRQKHAAAADTQYSVRIVLFSGLIIWRRSPSRPPISPLVKKRGRVQATRHVKNDAVVYCHYSEPRISSTSLPDVGGSAVTLPPFSSCASLIWGRQ